MYHLKIKRLIFLPLLVTLLCLVACGHLGSEKRKSAEVKSRAEEKAAAQVVPLGHLKERKLVRKYCREMERSFKRYGWGRSQCLASKWLVYDKKSVKGRPLVFKVFGRFPDRGLKPKNFNTTLIMCGVHGDEITPVKFCYDVLAYLKKVQQGNVFDFRKKQKASLKNRLVIVAPLVSPDSYFKRRPSRTNANGVDINRNFPTSDFRRMALKMWKTRYKRDKRRYPGKSPMSEPETAFQVDLVETFKPDKIISVHAPLTMLDYDGPANQHTGGMVGSRANQLLIRMSEKAKGYRIKNYPFFPGSLGNWAGNERNIPTFTLELPSSDSRYHKKYWQLFKGSIHSAVMHNLKNEIDVALDDSGATSYGPN